MAIFESVDTLKRKANLCHLLISDIPDNELIKNYGFGAEEILEAKKCMDRFDDYAYLQGKIRKAFRRR